jgi:hypothetical protein
MIGRRRAITGESIPTMSASRAKWFFQTIAQWLVISRFFHFLARFCTTK